MASSVHEAESGLDAGVPTTTYIGLPFAGVFAEVKVTVPTVVEAPAIIGSAKVGPEPYSNCTFSVPAEVWHCTEFHVMPKGAGPSSRSVVEDVHAVVVAIENVR